ncbi:MAG: radical SAM protein [Bacillota bacterium]
MEEIKSTPYSNLKIFAHADRLNKVRKGERVAPIYIRIKPTNYCNHRCNYCSYADSELGLRDSVNYQDQIPWGKMKEIISDFGDIGVKAVTFSGGGEPLIYPYIIDTMRGMLDKGIQISIITNGQNLEGEAAKTLTKANWVRISMDSANAETYSAIRKIPLSYFDKVCNNIDNFSKIKPSNCEFGINFVINHQNYNQIFDMAKMVRELGVNHIKFAARITKDLHEYHEKFKDEAIQQIHESIDKLIKPGFSIINKYEEDFETSMVFHRNYKKCFVQEVFGVIAADSKVYFCHDKAYVSSGVVGDLSQQSFKELWFSKETQERYKNFDARKECNHHCVFDDRNMMLNSFMSLDENHINFI